MGMWREHSGQRAQPVQRPRGTARSPVLLHQGERSGKQGLWSRVRWDGVQSSHAGPGWPWENSEISFQIQRKI